MNWITEWNYIPVDYGVKIGSIDNIIQETIFIPTINGSGIKIKFSNLYGRDVLSIKKAVIFVPDISSNEIDITCGNNTEITLLPGEEKISDEITFDIFTGTRIIIKIFFSNENNVYSLCTNWSGSTWYSRYYEQSGTGHTKEVPISKLFYGLEDETGVCSTLYGLTQLIIQKDSIPKSITLFGDSITHMSFFYDNLLHRIIKEYPNRAVLLNCGLGGNRLLRDNTETEMIIGNGRKFGRSGLGRFFTDAIENCKSDVVIFLEGINDLLHPYVFNKKHELPSASSLIIGLKKVVEICHSNKVKIYLCTIIPYIQMDSELFIDAESTRTLVNTWIRHQQISDGVIDFDRLLCNKDNEHKMLDHFHIGDGLHPNNEGGKAMSEIIPLVEIIDGELNENNGNEISGRERKSIYSKL